GGPDRVPSGEDQPKRRELDAFGPGGEVRVEEQRGDRCLVSFRMEVVLGRREDIEAGVVSEDRELPQLVQHLLVALVVPTDRAESLSILEGAWHRGENEEHEFHGTP